jgi:hypothetical protein
MGLPLALFTGTFQEDEQNKIMKPNDSATNHACSQAVNEEVIN